MELTPRQVFDRIDSVQLVDVREAEELSDGMIPGAQHIALGSVPYRYEELDRSRPVVVVCRSGRRSAAAADHLVHAGFMADTMAGGMIEWQATGLPVVAPLPHQN